MHDEENFLMLSGIQHFCFCQRQWALIHVEKQWQENVRTIEGKHIHEKVNDPFIVETRGDIIIARSVPLISYRLGLYGTADVVEFLKVNSQGVTLPSREGLWTPVPIEYKRGKPKIDEIDEVQLCAQAICLEEMMQIPITKGYLFYHLIRRRVEVNLDEKLRQTVQDLAANMHAIFNKGFTPKAKFSKHCKACSMVDLCQPKLSTKRKVVREYIKKGVVEG